MQIVSTPKSASGQPPKRPVQEQGDDSLIQSMARGDKHAVRTLFERYNVHVYRFVLRFIRDESLAEDVVSEVFLDVWRHAGSFQGQCRVSTWLLAIARNKAISACRQRKFAAPDNALFEAMEDPADNPEIVLEKKHRGALLRKCLEALSPIHRQIIDLVYFQSKSVQEVATIVGVPMNTVKTRMFYARRQLANLLGANGITTAALA